MEGDHKIDKIKKVPLRELLRKEDKDFTETNGVYNQKIRYISYLFYDIVKRNMAWSQMWLTGSVRTKVSLSDSA